MNMTPRLRPRKTASMGGEGGANAKKLKLTRPQEEPVEPVAPIESMEESETIAPSADKGPIGSSSLSESMAESEDVQTRPPVNKIEPVETHAPSEAVDDSEEIEVVFSCTSTRRGRVALPGTPVHYKKIIEAREIKEKLKKETMRREKVEAELEESKKTAEGVTQALEEKTNELVNMNRLLKKAVVQAGVELAKAEYLEKTLQKIEKKPELTVGLQKELKETTAKKEELAVTVEKLKRENEDWKKIAVEKRRESGPSRRSGDSREEDRLRRERDEWRDTADREKRKARRLSEDIDEINRRHAKERDNWKNDCAADRRRIERLQAEVKELREKLEKVENEQRTKKESIPRRNDTQTTASSFVHVVSLED